MWMLPNPSDKHPLYNSVKHKQEKRALVFIGGLLVWVSRSSGTTVTVKCFLSCQHLLVSAEKLFNNTGRTSVTVLSCSAHTVYCNCVTEGVWSSAAAQIIYKSFSQCLSAPYSFREYQAYFQLHIYQLKLSVCELRSCFSSLCTTSAQDFIMIHYYVFVMIQISRWHSTEYHESVW